MIAGSQNLIELVHAHFDASLKPAEIMAMRDSAASVDEIKPGITAHKLQVRSEFLGPD
jgi:hypothetical protein